MPKPYFSRIYGLLPGENNLSSGCHMGSRYVAAARQTPRWNRTFVSGPGTTESICRDLPLTHKNNHRSAHIALCFDLYMIWCNFYPRMSWTLIYVSFCLGFVNNPWSWNLQIVGFIASETAPDRRWIHLRSGATRKHVSTPLHRQLKILSFKRRIRKILIMLAAHIEGLRHPPKCLFQILFSFQCPFKLWKVCYFNFFLFLAYSLQDPWRLKIWQRSFIWILWKRIMTEELFKI
jgi:hypothetical protein